MNAATLATDRTKARLCVWPQAATWNLRTLRKGSSSADPRAAGGSISLVRGGDGGPRARYSDRAVGRPVEAAVETGISKLSVADCRTRRRRRRSTRIGHIDLPSTSTPPISTCAPVPARWCRWPSSLPGTPPTVTRDPRPRMPAAAEAPSGARAAGAASVASAGDRSDQ